jgi:SAM-dependent methyltransferase
MPVPSSPLPPAELCLRVGVLDREDPVASFAAMGAEQRVHLDRLLGDGWLTGGRRVLDFGCGAGKLLRHLLDVPATGGELHGCDIDAPSIAWLQEHLSPPLHVFCVEETPGLPRPDATFDLVLAMSVFTHLTDHWAGWLLELHRVLRPGALLVATFLGEGMSEAIAGEPWDADRIGMNRARAWQGWDEGGPSVQHSEWWLRAHWGRAFEVLTVEDGPAFGHGYLVARRRDVALSGEDLAAPERGEGREARALLHNVEQLARDCAELGADRELIRRELEAVRADRELVDAARARLECELAAWRAPARRSWRPARIRLR